MKYRFSARITVSAVTEVEASSEREALEIALYRTEAEMDFNGSGSAVDEAWLVEEIDGSPEGIELIGEVDEE